MILEKISGIDSDKDVCIPRAGSHFAIGPPPTRRGPDLLFISTDPNAATRSRVGAAS